MSYRFIMDIIAKFHSNHFINITELNESRGGGEGETWTIQKFKNKYHSKVVSTMNMGNF